MEEGSFIGRTKVIQVVLIIVFVVMVARLVQLQLFRHNYYTVLADKAHSRKYEVPATRGQIYAADRERKVPLVLNQDLKTLYADTRYVQDVQSTADQLDDLIQESSDSIEQKLQTNYASYIVLKKQVSPEIAEKINKLQLAGIGLSDAPTRAYPEGSLAAQILGFVNADGHGQYGIEEYFNTLLAGKAGLLNAKTDTRGIPIATGENIMQSARNGSDIVLTIDRNVQAKVESVLKNGVEKYHAKSASAVILDANSGAVVAMANYPTYDPGNYQKVQDYNVFSNNSLQGFEPGSNFKVFTMSTGLENKAVTPDTTFNNTGSITLNDYTIKNAGGIPNGTFSMKQVIEKSINTGVVFVLERLGGGIINSTAKNKLYEYLTDRFGFGKVTGIELANEAAGHLEKPSGASDITYANMTFGQGLTASVLQVTAAAAAVVNGGTLYKPYIVDEQISPDGHVLKTKPQVKREHVVSAETSEKLKGMMEAVVVSGGGFGTKIPGYRIGGKTGTAQIPNPQGGYFDNRDIGSFTGFAPVDHPKYVMMVRIDEPHIPGFAGSAAAGPMFGEIMKWLLPYEGIAPTS